ncbi:MAG: hypothetical protein ACI8XO_002480 [Verrucomicrobiales bacterium]|jgi:hypothetical protein
MKARPNFVLAGSALALLLSLTSCGKKEVAEEPSGGAQSAHGKMLEAAQKTVDEANARTERVEEAADQ